MANMDATANDGASGDADIGRTLWRRARQQLSEHELALHETQLELTNERRICQQHKDATAKLLREAAQIRAVKTELETGAVAMYKQLQAVQRDCDVEKADASALAHTLDMAKQRLAAAEAARTQARAKRTQELAAQQAHNEMLRSHLKQPSASGAVLAAASSEGTSEA